MDQQGFSSQDRTKNKSQYLSELKLLSVLKRPEQKIQTTYPFGCLTQAGKRLCNVCYSVLTLYHFARSHLALIDEVFVTFSSPWESFWSVLRPYPFLSDLFLLVESSINPLSLQVLFLCSKKSFFISDWLVISGILVKTKRLHLFRQWKKGFQFIPRQQIGSLNIRTQ